MLSVPVSFPHVAVLPTPSASGQPLLGTQRITRLQQTSLTDPAVPGSLLTSQAKESHQPSTHEQCTGLQGVLAPQTEDMGLSMAVWARPVGAVLAGKSLTLHRIVTGEGRNRPGSPGAVGRTGLCRRRQTLNDPSPYRPWLLSITGGQGLLAWDWTQFSPIKTGYTSRAQARPHRECGGGEMRADAHSETVDSSYDGLLDAGELVPVAQEPTGVAVLEGPVLHLFDVSSS